MISLPFLTGLLSTFFDPQIAYVYFLQSFNTFTFLNFWLNCFSFLPLITLFLKVNHDFLKVFPLILLDLFSPLLLCGTSCPYTLQLAACLPYLLNLQAHNNLHFSNFTLVTLSWAQSLLLKTFLSA